MELHPADEATLYYDLRSARHGLLSDDLPEFLHWLRAIEDKVNQELRWQEKDEQPRPRTHQRSARALALLSTFEAVQYWRERQN
jgi:hypothetical protein